MEVSQLHSFINKCGNFLTLSSILYTPWSRAYSMSAGTEIQHTPCMFISSFRSISGMEYIEQTFH